MNEHNCIITGSIHRPIIGAHKNRFAFPIYCFFSKRRPLTGDGRKPRPNFRLFHTL